MDAYTSHAPVITVLRSGVPDALSVAPQRLDAFRNDAVLEVISGRVVGAIDRVVSLNDDHQVQIFHMANVSGFEREGIDTAATLASLAAVTQYLADEMGQLEADVVADPSDDALFRTNDGHGHRVIVEKAEGGGGIVMTIRTSMDDRDAQRAVLSRGEAIALRNALDAI